VSTDAGDVDLASAAAVSRPASLARLSAIAGGNLEKSGGGRALDRRDDVAIA